MLLQKTTKRKNKIMIKKEKNGNNNKRKKTGGRKMKVEVRKRANLINAKLKQKYNKNDKRNNANSISRNNSTKLLVPRNGRKKLNIYN